MGNITEKEAVEISENYFDFETANELKIVDIKLETPCGNYWFPVKR